MFTPGYVCSSKCSYIILPARTGMCQCYEKKGHLNFNASNKFPKLEAILIFYYGKHKREEMKTMRKRR